MWRASQPRRSTAALSAGRMAAAGRLTASSLIGLSILAVRMGRLEVASLHVDPHLPIVSSQPCLLSSDFAGPSRVRCDVPRTRASGPVARPLHVAIPPDPTVPVSGSDRGRWQRTRLSHIARSSPCHVRGFAGRLRRTSSRHAEMAVPFGGR